MFGFLFKYVIKRAILNKESLFWVLIFPFFLSTIFGIVFTRMDNNTELSPIPIMVEDRTYKEILNQIDLDDKKIFDIKDYKNPDQALESGKVEAVIKGDLRKPKLVIKNDTVNTAIVHGVVSQINHMGLSVGQLMKNPENRSKIEAILKDLRGNNDFEFENALNLKNKSGITIYIYSQIGRAHV